MYPKAKGVQNLKLILGISKKSDLCSRLGAGQNRSARSFHYGEIIGVRLVVQNFLQALGLFSELLNAFFIGNAGGRLAPWQSRGNRSGKDRSVGRWTGRTG